ncbi:hypothetical protein SAMN05216266_12169 [Amycolatopsis marina]|uniref:Uncharacterized protein n=1 Tax=Amycolatopsis marina TaxID=490629 RepID=A0A1I1CAA3_9PSEU|nr:hypothetical protein [Amycolatopsis marina]SFB57848.1 hypothetical protein SAMN05216266_12169 [Amycolatopsis marina]
MRSTSPARPTSRYLLAVLTSAGLAVTVLGSFLPWLRSGNVTRNSYESAGLADHFALVDNDFLVVTLRTWIAIPALGALCVALIAVRLDRSAGVLTLAVSALAGTPAGILTVQASDPAGLVGIAPAGPITSLAGSIIALIGALGILVVAGRTRGPADGRAGTRT